MSMSNPQDQNAGAYKVAFLIYAYLVTLPLILAGALWLIAAPEARRFGPLFPEDPSNLDKIAYGLGVLCAILAVLLVPMLEKAMSAGQKKSNLGAYLVRVSLLEVVCMLGFVQGFLQKIPSLGWPLLTLGFLLIVAQPPKRNDTSLTSGATP